MWRKANLDCWSRGGNERTGGTWCAAGGVWFEREARRGRGRGRVGVGGSAVGGGGCNASCMHSAASAFVNAKASTDFRCTFSALVCFILDVEARVFVKC